MAFEKFKRTEWIRKNRKYEEFVSLCLGGAIYLSTGLVQSKLKHFTHAELFYDEAKRRIGIKFYRESRADAFEISDVGAQGCKYIQALYFRRKYDIPQKALQIKKFEYDETKEFISFCVDDGRYNHGKKKTTKRKDVFTL